MVVYRLVKRKESGERESRDRAAMTGEQRARLEERRRERERETWGFQRWPVKGKKKKKEARYAREPRESNDERARE